VNLDKLLYNLPSGTERYKLLSTGKSLTNTDDPCPISDSTDLSRNINIETIQSGLLELNQDTATKDKYKYVWRPYNNEDIATSLDSNYFEPFNRIVGQICPELNSTTVFGKEINCDSNTPGLGVSCPTGFTCKLDGNKNDNNVCV
jgi:hypothetical protein